MDRTLISRIYKEYNIPKFHGDELLDTLKYLSELETLPELIRFDYQNQYESKIIDVGSSTNYNLGKQIYTHFNGDDNVILGEVVDQHSWRNVTLKACKITIPYLKRLSEYSKKTLQYNQFKPIEYEYVVVDIIVDDYSLLQSFLNTPLKDFKLTTFGLFCLINDRDYKLITYFAKPYNGINSCLLPGIFADICKKNPNRIISYLESLHNSLSYHTDKKIDIKNL